MLATLHNFYTILYEDYYSPWTCLNNSTAAKKNCLSFAMQCLPVHQSGTLNRTLPPGSPLWQYETVCIRCNWSIALPQHRQAVNIAHTQWDSCQCNNTGLRFSLRSMGEDWSVWTNLYALTESDFKTKYYHSVQLYLAFV